MAIELIDAELCSGCAACVDSCPMDVIRMDPDEDVAVIRYGLAPNVGKQLLQEKSQ